MFLALCRKRKNIRKETLRMWCVVYITFKWFCSYIFKMISSQLNLKLGYLNSLTHEDDINITTIHVYPSFLVLVVSYDEKGQQTGRFLNQFPPGGWQLRAPVLSETQRACEITPSHQNSFVEPVKQCFTLLFDALSIIKNTWTCFASNAAAWPK